MGDERRAGRSSESVKKVCLWTGSDGLLTDRVGMWWCCLLMLWVTDGQN